MDRVTVIDELQKGPATDVAPPAAVSDTLAIQAGRAQAFDALTMRDYFAGAALTGILSAHTGEVSLPSDAKAAKWRSNWPTPC